MNYFKKNKWVLIPITIFVAIMVFAIVAILNLLIPNNSKDLYGNRLEGIENYAISNDTVDAIKQSILDTNLVKSVEFDLKGKLVNFIIVVNDDVDRVNATGLSDKVLSGFDDNIKSFYDFQILINTEGESEIFPIIGYKHISSLNFVWTNN